MTTEFSNRVRKSRRGPPKGFMPSAKSLANLIPYKPGQNGHPQTYSLLNRLKHSLDKPFLKPKDDAPVGDHIVYATLKGAVDLVPVAVRETWDRVEGKLQDTQPPSQDNRVISATFVFLLPDGTKLTAKQMADRQMAELEEETGQ